MSIFKSAEVWFRTQVVHLLKFIAHRNRPLPSHVDFNACKFLFVRNDRIGDVLVSSPIIYHLKNKYPNATLDFFLSEKNHFVLENEPLVRRRWLYNKRLIDTIKLLSAIRREHYDFVVDLWDAVSSTSTVICLLSGAKWSVGLEKENAFVYDIRVPLFSRSDTHIVDRLAMLLTPFGIDGANVPLILRYTVSDESRRFAKAFVSEHRLDSYFRVGININAGTEVRFWGVENFQELIRRLSAEHPEMRFIIMHKLGERERAHAIAAPFPTAIVGPETPVFDQFAALIEKMNFLITPDTSAVHLAAAFQVPIVALYVQSAAEFAIWSPYGVEHESLVTPVSDLKTIACSDVHDAVNRLYERVFHRVKAN
ncbi:MAG: glycosyltransferase family 9 protein [Ignavibacteriae bacterium]|nr:glycosyltransferase family 9 protein [Ignavibacteriota bacterium]